MPEQRARRRTEDQAELPLRPSAYNPGVGEVGRAARAITLGILLGTLLVGLARRRTRAA